MYKKRCRYQYDAEYREVVKQRTRYRYQKNKESEKLRIKIWKHSNPNRSDAYNKKRIERLQRKSDGSVTRNLVKQILMSSNSCVYCGTSLNENTATIDHIIPLSKGGLHAAYNLVACCGTCNAKKNDLLFDEWIERLSPENKSNALSLYKKRYGRNTSPSQMIIPLEF